MTHRNEKKKVTKPRPLHLAARAEPLLRFWRLLQIDAVVPRKACVAKNAVFRQAVLASPAASGTRISSF